MHPDTLATELLPWLRERTGNADLEYASPPRLLGIGAEADAWEFSLRGAPSLPETLVARVYPPHETAETARRDAEILSLVVEAGARAPAVVGWGVVGEQARPFLVQERIPGRPFFEIAMLACGAALVASFFGGAIAWLAVGALYVTVMVREQRRIHALDVRSTGSEAAAKLGLESKLAELGERIEPLGDAPLSEAQRWLTLHRPKDAPARLCHGDFWPGNVLMKGLRVTGVIDWGDATLAPVEFDLAWTRIAWMTGLPLPLPDRFSPLGARLSRPLVAFVLSLHRWGYALVERLDRERVRYFESYHCAKMLVFIASLTGAADAGHAMRANPWNDEAVVRMLRRRLADLTGVAFDPA